MPSPTVSFLLGLLLLGYLSTFVLFAILRVITGVSIQRIGFWGVRRIAFSPRDGLTIRIRGIGFMVHRPTFAQPTWISLTITELQLLVDLQLLLAKRKGARAGGGSDKENTANAPASAREQRMRTWTNLLSWKERVKRVHRQVEWLRLVDLLVTGASVTVKDVGTLSLERLILSVDTRPKTVDRSKLFQHHKSKNETKRPAEWKSVVRSVLYTPDGKDSMELLDYCTFNVHGFLHKKVEGLRDASIALKIGRLTIPWDEFEAAANYFKRARASVGRGQDSPRTPQIKFDGAKDDPPDAAEEDAAILEAISDSKEFATSILRGIQEVQLAVGFLGLSRRIKALREFGRQVYFNLAMKEVGLDITRLEPRSPAHRMYFSPNDVAHQALLTAIAISAGFDDGREHPERLVYVPMVTATIKTTLPSKIIQLSVDPNPSDKNTNIFFANLVCTSPSIDLDPKHLPFMLALLKRLRSQAPKQEQRHPARDRPSMMGRFLPMAIVKIAVQEPVVRVSLPRSANGREYDMIISSTSSISLDLDARHESEEKHHYSVSLDYRQSTHRLYGQTADGTKHDLLFADTVEIKVDVTALPEMSIYVDGKFQTLSIYFVQPEICGGIRQIMQALHKEIYSSSRSHSDSSPPHKQSFLRHLPNALQHVYVQGSDFNVEVAGKDEAISKYSRGMSLQLESWTTEYKAHKHDTYTVTRRRSVSRSSRDHHRSKAETQNSPRKKYATPGDGRRLAIHVEGLEGLIIDTIPKSDTTTFLSLPAFEIAFSTSTDQQGPIFHINSKAEKLYIFYSLYYHFAIGIAFLLLRKTFAPESTFEHAVHVAKHHATHQSSLKVPQEPETHSPAQDEITTIDFRADLIQVKATMPADPPLMVQIYGIEAGKHRWASPFVRSRLARMYAGTPRMTAVWSRILSIKGVRVDLRSMRRKVGKQLVDEKSVDVSSEALRIGVPHQLVVHSIFDNIVNVVKTTEQLHHHFATGSSEYVLAKHPEGPKHVPKISVRSQFLIFELEDSPFEYKLGVIYRTGLVEQQQRLARQEAFRLKMKKLNTKGSKHAPNTRASSARPDERKPATNREKSGHRRSQSADGPRDRSSNLRYNAEGAREMSGVNNRSVEHARETLDKFNSDSWKTRIDRALSSQKHAMQDIRTLFWGADEIPEEAQETEPIMATNMRPGLLTLCVSDVNVTVDKPSFPIGELPDYLHDIGKGMPKDMKYGLLIPMSLNVSTGEMRGMLRDYPLPLIHIPAIQSGQSPRLPSFHLSTDFVIAEEFHTIESQRHVNVVVVPPERLGPDDQAKKFAIDVRRTISPVKTYTNMKITINTSAPTRITWGTSYQPAIQDMMQVIEGFTKPPVDPSDRVGFWDKIRLSFHSRITIAWKGDGDFHVNWKGSRDPYVVTGNGAGFVMVWRNNVCWKIAQDPDPRKFMTVDSGEYILAIPNFNHYARQTWSNEDVQDNGSMSLDSGRSTAQFRKVVMKLSGNVQWLAGLVFEKALKDGKRNFNFDPHWTVHLRHPDYARAPRGQTYDAYSGIRSQHIHLSIAVIAPQSRDWNVLNLKPSDNYNSVHLTPRFFTHFLNWWHLFSGVMSLPIRQGPLWSSPEKSSKKFGRHLATIKYNLLLSPVFIAHIYKHKDVEDYASEAVAATGLKMKLDSFMLDLHQRRETFEIPGDRDGALKQTSGMKINQCQLDFIAGDIRAVSAGIRGTSKDEIEKADNSVLPSFHNFVSANIDMARFTIPDNDFSWIDMDDFVELDWILPQESNPKTKILPLAWAPRFTYFRQTDHGDNISGDTTRSSPFGDEPTHYCVMSHKNDPRRVQADLIQERLNNIVEQIKENDLAHDEQHVKIVRDAKHDGKVQEGLEQLKAHAQALKYKHDFLEGMLRELLQKIKNDDRSAVAGLETTFDTDGEEPRSSAEKAGVDALPLGELASEFNNRFVVHNPQIKWNNSLRNIILRRAVKFILDIIEEKKKKTKGQASAATLERQQSMATNLSSPGVDDEITIQDRIEQLLADGKAMVEADDTDQPKSESKANASADEEISTEFVALNTYHFRLIAPQIQLQSEKNPKSVVLIAAKGMQLKVVQIMDKDRVMDEISGLVQRRFSAAMDSLQMFVTSTKTFSMEHLHMYSGNKYGTKAGAFWPPWVPMEVMYEFSGNPYGFSRVVQRTSASLRYDKFNNLRLKYNDDVTKGQEDSDSQSESTDNRMDHLYVEFPHFRAICDSSQYYAMYIIVIDLLLYSEPLEKTRSERLEKIMLASDFSDLRGAPELVEMLQARIRQLEEIKLHFQVNEKLLDRQGWKDRISMDEDLASCEDELFFMMKAITTSQQRVEERSTEEGSNGILRWLITAKELAWHLIRNENESLLEFQLKDTTFDRTDNSDGSNINCVELGRINGFNLLPGALYPQIFAPYIDDARGYHDPGREKMLRVRWLMMEAIAGIPVMDYFEVDVVPIKAQMEREVAKKLFEYIFPGVGGNAFESSGVSPFQAKKMLPTQQEEDGENGDASKAEEPTHGDSGAQTNAGKGAGALENRLQPTFKLGDPRNKNTKQGSTTPQSNSHHWHLFQHSNRSGAGVNRKASKNTAGSNSNLTLSRTPSHESTAMVSVADSDKTKKSSRRSMSKERKKDKDKDKEEPSDDLTQMMSRASNYMTLSLFKVHGVTLCLSYKGRGSRNLEDVHDLVFRLPTLEYRNKTWSNLDLALQLKKDVIRALISHAGAIVGNKFAHHRPSKQQQSRLREMANNSLVMSISHDFQQPSVTPSSTGTPSSASVQELDDDDDETVAYDHDGDVDVDGESTSSDIRNSFASTRDGGSDNGSVGPTRTRPGTATSTPQGFRTAHGNGSPATSSPYNKTQRRSSNANTIDTQIRGRSGSVGNSAKKRFSGIMGGTKQSNGNEDGDTGGEKESEAAKMKSRILLGGQKLLNKLPHRE
ncbi:hypothetical protein MBLNU457_1859t1 [Dothideomycetes sp. NU457]